MLRTRQALHVGVYIIDDCAITPNWLILMCLPFEDSIACMKAGKQHWAWHYDLKATFTIVPRRSSTPLPPGWSKGECRHYERENCMPIHTAGAWEASGILYIKSSRVHDDAFQFFLPENSRMPDPETKADFVRWEFDLSQPSGSRIPDPVIVLDLPCEFPRIDERFMTKEYEYLFLSVFLPEKKDGIKNIFHGLNAPAMHSHRTGITKYFYAGDDSLVQEPIFIPRSKEAPEGDGWVIAMVERRAASRCDLVVLDTKPFERPIAVVELPFHVKAQIHGNWVGVEGDGELSGIVRGVEVGEVSGAGEGGTLEPLI